MFVKHSVVNIVGFEKARSFDWQLV